MIDEKLEGRTYAEVAELHGISVARVKQLARGYAPYFVIQVMHLRRELRADEERRAEIEEMGSRYDEFERRLRAVGRDRQADRVAEQKREFLHAVGLTSAPT
jgi:transcriptional regulator with XRE-family HTH domain